MVYKKAAIKKRGDNYPLFKYMNSSLFAIILSFYFLNLSPALADTIIMKNGRELKGGIIKETDHNIVLSFDFGNLTLNKSSIKKIIRDNEKMLSGSSGKSSKSSRSSHTNSSSRKKRKKMKKMNVSELVEELGKINLGEWEHESHKVTEKEKANYKVLKTDGTVELTKGKPGSPDGVDKLWMKRSLGRVDAGSLILFTGVTGAVWRRLYWSEEGKSWTDDHPNLRAYKRVRKLNRELLKRIIKAGGGKSNDYRKILSAVEVLRSSHIMKADALEKAKKNIESITGRVGKSWGGARMLREIVSLDYSEEKPSQESKIQIAKDQRTMLINAANRF